MACLYMLPACVPTKLAAAVQTTASKHVQHMNKPCHHNSALASYFYAGTSSGAGVSYSTCSACLAHAELAVCAVSTGLTLKNPSVLRC